jgi:hypothetical protein
LTDAHIAEVVEISVFDQHAEEITDVEVLIYLDEPLPPDHLRMARQRAIRLIRLELLTRQVESCRALVDSGVWKDFVHLPGVTDCHGIDAFASKLDLPDFVIGKAAELPGLREEDSQIITNMLIKAGEATFPGLKPFRWAANTVRGAHLIMCSAKIDCPNARRLANDISDITQAIIVPPPSRSSWECPAEYQ